MKISIVMCTYNGEKYLRSQLKSIREQTLQPDEMIICDDCSTDKTVQIIKETLCNWNVSWKIICNKSNIGFRKNFQKAIGLSSGDVIFLSDQDDVWNHDKLELVSKVFSNDANAILAFHDAVLVDENLNTIRPSFWHELEFSPLDFEKGDYSCLFYGNVIQGAACAFRKELFIASQPFPNELFHDEWLGINAALKGKIIPIPKVLLKYRQTGHNALGGICRKNLYIRIKNWIHSARSILEANKANLIRLKKVWQYASEKYNGDSDLIGNITVKSFYDFLYKREQGVTTYDFSMLPSFSAYIHFYKNTQKAKKLYVKDRLCLFLKI
jgi:glycosyltransferase involved in cell wall biosynthesis